MSQIWNEIHLWIVAGIGGFIGAALLLPTKLGEALIQFRIAKALENFKADQSRELERLKEQLGRPGDRDRRSNEMEFAAIEKVWRAFVKAWLSANTCAGAMISVPRFRTMTAEDIQSFISSSDLSEPDRESLRKARDREKEYTTIIGWRMVLEAGTDIYQARLTLREQRIFMPADLTKMFAEGIERMSGMQIERRLHLENPHVHNTIRERQRQIGRATAFPCLRN